MRAKTIAVANMKGGVGKTTLVVFLAEALAAEGHKRVLVVDADPQASASVSLAGDAELKQLIENGCTLDAYVGDILIYPKQLVERPITDIIRENVSSTTSENRTLAIDLLACGPYLRLVEKEAIRHLAKRGLGPDAYEMKLWATWTKELALLRERYDFIVMDCAPSLSALNEMMIRSADLVLLPTIPDFISAFGLNGFLHSVWHYPIASLPRPTRLPYVVISRFQANLKQHQASVRDLEAEANKPEPDYAICKTYIPNTVQLSQALAAGELTLTFTNKYTSKLINDVIFPLTNEIGRVLDVYAP